MLMTVQNNETTVGENPPKLHMLSGVLARHALKILDECFLAIRDRWVVLGVGVSDVPTNGLRWVRLIEHQIIEFRDGGLVGLQVHGRRSCVGRLVASRKACRIVRQ